MDVTLKSWNGVGRLNKNDAFTKEAESPLRLAEKAGKVYMSSETLS